MSMKNLQNIFLTAKNSIFLKYFKWVILLSVLIIGLVLADGADVSFVYNNF